MDGFKKHRSHASTQPTVGMTCFLEPVCTRRDDMTAEACNLNVKPAAHVIPQAAHVIPAEACAQAWNLCAAVQEARTLMDGFKKHRSLATAQPSAGMTCFLEPVWHAQE